ncbi:MAG: hypothetical protein LBT42_00195 [Tannerella sp.]|nr:hypothetical protein [Tannerella sp.]
MNLLPNYKRRSRHVEGITSCRPERSQTTVCHHCDVSVIGSSNRHCEERSNPDHTGRRIASFLAMTDTAPDMTMDDAYSCTNNSNMPTVTATMPTIR